MDEKEDNPIVQIKTHSKFEKFKNIYTITSSLDKRLIYLGGQSINKKVFVNIIAFSLLKKKIKGKVIYT
jgi:hypothetical protein